MIRRSRLVLGTVISLCALAFPQAVTLLPSSRHTLFDQKNAPLADGFAYTHARGRNTPKTTGVDPKGAGRAIIYRAGEYREIVSDGARNVQRDLPVVTSTPQNSLENAEIFNVVTLGADPTGVEDSAPAFRSAAGSNRIILVPPGEYRF